MTSQTDIAKLRRERVLRNKQERMGKILDEPQEETPKPEFVMPSGGEREMTSDVVGPDIMAMLQGKKEVNALQFREKIMLTFLMVLSGGFMGLVFVKDIDLSYDLYSFTRLWDKNDVFEVSRNIVIALEIVVRLTAFFISGASFSWSNLGDSRRITEMMLPALGMFKEFTSDCAVFCVSFVLVTALATVVQ